jgi:hypothetical protein
VPFIACFVFVLTCLTSISTAAPEGQALSVTLTGGGLETAATVLQARFGTTINYEGVPMVVEGTHYTPWVRTPAGVQHYVPVALGELAFSYPAKATVREAVEAAVAAHNGAANGYARYRVVAHDDVLDLVPTEVLTSGGWQPYVSPLDTVISLPMSTGRGTELWHAAVAALNARTPQVTMLNRENQVMESMYDPQTALSSSTAPAREILAQILGTAIYANQWQLKYSLPNLSLRGWLLDFRQVQPEDDAVGNLTPL